MSAIAGMLDTRINQTRTKSCIPAMQIQSIMCCFKLIPADSLATFVALLMSK